MNIIVPDGPSMVMVTEDPERTGVPWPVIRCPAGMDAGPCRIKLYNDPAATPPEACEFATR